MKTFRFRLLASLAFAIALAQGESLLPCTGTGLVPQQQQSNCVVANPGGDIVITSSFTNDPTFVNTPVTQTVNQYQTTLTALLNGGTTVFQETFDAPFSDPSVQNAVLQADALLSMDGAAFGIPLLTSTSTMLQSSILSYVATSPAPDLASLIPCLDALVVSTTGTCAGVTVTLTESGAITYGPATIMIGPGDSDEFYVEGGQEDINVDFDFVYTVDQNAITTNTYLTTQPYEIDGTTGSSSVPEPGTWTLMLAGLGAIWLCKRKRVSARWGILPVLALAAGLAQGGPLLACPGTNNAVQEGLYTNCIINNPGGPVVLTASSTNDPTFVNTPVTQTVNQYQTTLTALLNGGATVFQETFDAPFSDPSVQNAIVQADALLALDGAAFGGLMLTSTSTTLQSSAISYVPTSPVLDLVTDLNACQMDMILSPDGPPASCSGVMVTDTGTATVTFGPATIMIGPSYSDVFFVLSGQEDINLNSDFTYIVDQNATTTNTYLTTQSYEIDGTTGASSVPEPGTWTLMLAGLGAIWLGRRKRVFARWGILPVLALAAGLAHAGPPLPCTGSTLYAQEEQSNCVVANPGTPLVITESATNDPTFVSTPASQSVNQYQTTLTAVLNGGTAVFQESFGEPLSDLSVQNAILQADAVLASDWAAFGGLMLTSTSTTLQSSLLSYSPTSPILDLATLLSCGLTLGATGTCSGVAVTYTTNSTETFGPATIMIGPDYSDEFYVVAGQTDINVNSDYTYTVDQNAITTNTYLTTQSYEIDGTTGSSSVPEPGTWTLMLAGLGAIWLGRRKRVSARWGILPVLALAVGLAHAGPLLPCTGSTLYAQEEQSNCVVANPGTPIVITVSSTNDPSYVDMPSTQRIDEYQTTLTAILNGGAAVFEESFGAPFGDPSVQAAVLQAEALLSTDGATYSSPLLTSASITLQSSILSYVPTSQTLDLPTLISCGITLGAMGSCLGVPVTTTELSSETFGPATLMIGLGQSDQFDLQSGQEDINADFNYTYTVDQNAITTNTYLTTQTYEIDGTTGSSSVPEPGTWTLMLAGLGAIWLAKRVRRTFSRSCAVLSKGTRCSDALYGFLRFAAGEPGGSRCGSPRERTLRVDWGWNRWTSN